MLHIVQKLQKYPILYEKLRTYINKIDINK